MIRRLWTLGILLGLALLPALVGRAVPRVVTDHAKPTRTFRVAMLLLKSQTSTVAYWNSDPWYLPVVNHSPFKPAGWTLENPLAPAKIPANAALINSGARFQADPKGAGPTSTNWFLNGKAVGAPLTKDDPAYWVVQIDKVSLDALADFDLLILNGHSASTLTADERNALRYLLERGATIWINNSQRTGNQLFNFFLDPALVFQPGPYDFPLPANTSTWMKVVAPDHWLMNAYYPIAPQEANFMRDNVGDKSFILSGVAGYAGGTNSQIQEVVRLIRNNADGTVTPMGPAIAAGRVGNGLIIATGTDIMGATSDWYEFKHNQANLRNLAVWPSDESMHIAGQPNDHYIFMAANKLFFNMLARPASWYMVSGNPVASRTYDASFSATLARGWMVGFTALSDPVSSGNFVAVTGNATNPPGLDATELRLYRTRRVTDDDGAVLDYPYGLSDDFQRKLTPTLIPWWQQNVNYLAGGAIRVGAYFYFCKADHLSSTDSKPETGAQWTTFWTRYPYGPFPNDATADSEMDLCFAKAPTAGWSWIGSPVFGKISTGTMARTVVYALQQHYNAVAGRWECQVRAFAVDPFVMTAGIPQVGEDIWAASPSPLIITGLPRVSMTLSNNRLVVTTLGKTDLNSNWRIFVVDARTGAARAQVGGAPEYGANFRPTGPASMVTARLEFEASDMEAGLSATAATIGSAAYNPTLLKLRQEVVEMLAVTGEYFSPNQTAALAADPTIDPTAGGQAALFLIPPTFVFRSTSAQRGFFLNPSNIPADLTITDANGRSYTIGSPTSDFRRRYILCIKAEPNGLKITFRNWDVFFPQGVAASVMALPLSVRFTPERTIVGGGSAQSASQVTVQGVQLAMGYPILLRGTQRFDILDAANTPLRSTLRWFDGDILYNNAAQRIAGGSFGYNVDAPPLVFRDQLIIGTNTLATMDYALLKNSQEMLSPVPLRLSGAVSAVRLRIPGLSKASNPAPPGNISDMTGQLAWQFQGDTHGPRNWSLQQWFWRTNFPYPPATDKDTIYAAGLYDGYGDYQGGNVYSALNPSSLNRGLLYAVNPDAPRYLTQTMGAGMVAAGAPPAGYDPTHTLLIDQTGLQDAVRRVVLRVGVRVLLKNATTTWDMGAVTQIRAQVGVPNTYWVVFDRPYDAAIINPVGCLALTATTAPYVSHVRAWNADTGEEPLRRYWINGLAALRTSEGFCAVPPNGDSACPDNTFGQQEVMVALNELSTVCHDPWTVDTTGALNPLNTLIPNDNAGFLPADWSQHNIAYLPRLSLATPVSNDAGPQQALNPSNLINQSPELNYMVDARTGRIELSARAAGEFADRFVAVHYFTLEMATVPGLGIRPIKVHHAEVMYVPSPVRWQYLFPDAIPDSGPTVVNNTLYLTAIHHTTTGKWQPMLYAFATVPDNPLNVQPLWSQPLDALRPDTDPLPYRGITTAVPTPSGVLVGTALPNTPANELALFSDRGLMIADGHRIIRTDHDGQVTWQASATMDYDPLAMFFANNPDPIVQHAIQTIGLNQQEFVLATRVRRLPNGNVLVCDTGAGRVVEFDRGGQVVWQYPDSNMTYMDEDRKLDGAHFRADAAMYLLRAQGVTPPKLRLSAPRDVRRYYTEKAINDPTFLKWDLLPGVALGRATVRWEITLIADTGNTRVLETIRPLVRLDEADVTEVGRLSFARGFIYRPDYYYIYNGNRVYLRQSVEVLANGLPTQTLTGAGLPGEQASLLLADGSALKAPLAFSAVMRYPGSDGQLVATRDDMDPVMDGVRTRELLVAIGNPSSDPSDKTKFLRTAFIHVVGDVRSATLGNYASLTQAVGIGDTTLHVSYAADMKVGDAVLLYDPTNADPKAVSTSVIKTVDAAQKLITIDPASDKTFPLDGRVVITSRWNALQPRPASARDYASIAQLDLITLTTPAGAQELRALVVDAVGVREVPLDPTRQAMPVFEMGQKEYTNSTADGTGYLWDGKDRAGNPVAGPSLVDVRYPTLLPSEQDALKARLAAWKKDFMFAPIAVLRLDPGPGLTATDPRTVRYLIAQMNTTINPDPATWMNNKAERRIHLFEARWFDLNSPNQLEPLNGWRIIDSEWNYFVYPDPLSPGFPNLPGWSYPLSQPLGLDRD